jgi:inorganic triphosphatase YgiF/positive regulator of sigma E activity
MSNTIEREFKYRVNEQAARLVETFIKTTSSVAKYQLGACTEVVNYDCYFDTIDRLLSKHKASLRLRHQGQNRFLITFKSETQATGKDTGDALKGLYERLEIEGTPDVETLQKVQLQLRNVGLANSSVDDIRLITYGVQGVFSLWGLERLFELENQRISRLIIDSGNPIGEITFDKVHLEIDRQHSTFYEIEIEANIDGTTEFIAEIIEFLKVHFPTQLAPSMLSKYERGLEFVGAEEHHKIETKLIVPDQNEYDLLTSLKSLSTVADFDLGLAVECSIVDTYYDTEQKDLSRNKCYLRIREEGNRQLVTLRKYTLTDDKRMIDTLQMKQTINENSLRQVLEYLMDQSFIRRKRTNSVSLQNARDTFVSYGLRHALTVQTKRVFFPVSDRARRFASIKHDEVQFIFQGHKFHHKEVEISTSNKDDLVKIQALAYYLIARYQLKPTNKPKYEIGLALLRGEGISTVDVDVQIYQRNQTTIQVTLDIKARRRARQTLLLYTIPLILMIIGVVIITLLYSWNTVEPWTYFVGLLWGVGGYLYFALTNMSFEPQAIYHRLVKHYRRKLYSEFGINGADD